MGSAEERLGEPLDSDRIKTREGRGGKRFSYVSGGYVKHRLNMCLGPLGWSSSIVCMETRTERGETRRGDPSHVASCSCRMRIDAAADGRECHREDVGHGVGIARTLGDAVEGAEKQAATDALKRAAAGLGRSLGLELYLDPEELVDSQDLGAWEPPTPTPTQTNEREEAGGGPRANQPDALDLFLGGSPLMGQVLDALAAGGVPPGEGSLAGHMPSDPGEALGLPEQLLSGSPQDARDLGGFWASRPAERLTREQANALYYLIEAAAGVDPGDAFRAVGVALGDGAEAPTYYQARLIAARVEAQLRRSEA